MSAKAGLVFPAARIGRHIRKISSSNRVSPRASVCAAAVIEYLAAEILELACNEMDAKKKTQLTPVFIQRAIFKDPEFEPMLKNTLVYNGGLPHALPPKKAPKRPRKPKVVAAEEEKEEEEEEEEEEQVAVEAEA
jgi:histone H2A